MVALRDMFIHYNEYGHCGLFWVDPTHTVLLLCFHSKSAAENSRQKLHYVQIFE